ncbi:AI-2E family transporter [Natronospora cellulosivora (SeqCode)]
MDDLKEKDAKIAIMLLIIGGIIYFIFRIRIILLPFILGIFLSYLFFPLICFLREKKVPKTCAIYILIIVFLLIAAVIAFLIFPVLMKELESLSENIPEYIQQLDQYIDHLNHEYQRVQLPALIKELLSRVFTRAEEQLLVFMENFTEILISSFSLLISLILAPFISYYILKDMDKFKKAFIRYLPEDKRSLFLKIISDINNIFLAYIRGQVWVSVVVGILCTLGLYFIGVRFFIILGIFATISNMAPFVGPIIGSIPAILIALLSSPTKALGVALLYFIIQQVESSLISPKIMSHELGIHPLGVLFALLVGAELMGLWGIILAVPVAAILKIFFKIFIEKY